MAKSNISPVVSRAMTSLSFWERWDRLREDGLRSEWSDNQLSNYRGEWTFQEWIERTSQPSSDRPPLFSRATLTKSVHAKPTIDLITEYESKVETFVCAIYSSTLTNTTALIDRRSNHSCGFMVTIQGQLEHVRAFLEFFRLSRSVNIWTVWMLQCGNKPMNGLSDEQQMGTDWPSVPMKLSNIDQLRSFYLQWFLILRSSEFEHIFNRRKSLFTVCGMSIGQLLSNTLFYVWWRSSIVFIVGWDLTTILANEHRVKAQYFVYSEPRKYHSIWCW